MNFLHFDDNDERVLFNPNASVHKAKNETDADAARAFVVQRQHEENYFIITTSHNLSEEYVNQPVNGLNNLKINETVPTTTTSTKNKFTLSDLLLNPTLAKFPKCNDIETRLADAVDAPLFHAANSTSYFLTATPLKDIMAALTAILTTQQDTLSFSHVPSEFIWSCVLIHRSLHCEYDIRVYKTASSSSGLPVYAVELTQVEGDRMVFRQQYSLLKKAVLIHSEVDRSISSSSNISTGSSRPPSAKSCRIPVDSMLLNGEPSIVSTSTVPSTDDLKRTILELFSSQHPMQQIEAAQRACELYASPSPIAAGLLISELDKQCVTWLVRMITDSYTVRDWSCQHSAWALARLTSAPEYCVLVCEVEPKFAEIVFRLAVEGTYATNIFRRQCITILHNLLIFCKSNVEKYVDSNSIAAWYEDNFTRAVLAAT